MKKSLKTLSILLAALAVVSFAGCKPEVEAGGKFSSVSSVDKNGTTGPRTVVLDLTSENKDLEKRFNADIEWFAWTKGDAKKRAPIAEDVEVYRSAIVPANKLNPGEKLTTGYKYIFKFVDSGDYNFYMYQTKKALKDDKGKDYYVNEADKDAVGVIKVDDKYPVKIHMNDSGWKFVPQNGILKITNNEPSKKAFFYKGDYTINEIWPLEKVEGEDVYTVNSDLKYTDLSIAPKESTTATKNGGSARFLFPAGKPLTIAIGQLHRHEGNGKFTAANEYRYVMPAAKGEKYSFNIKGWNDAQDRPYQKGDTEKLKDETVAREAKLISDVQLKEKGSEYFAFDPDITLTAHKEIEKFSLGTSNERNFSKADKKDEFTRPSATKAATMTTVEVYEIDPTVSSEK